MEKASERLIKKYPNRRLYDTSTSTYITLAEIKEMIVRSEPVRVVDAKTQADLTRSVLLQILLEEEIGATPLFSTEMLAQFIRFYDQASRMILGQYLEISLKTFFELQHELQERLRALFGAQSTLTPELMQQFLALQPAAMRTLMQTYLAETQAFWHRWHKHLEEQTKNWLNTLTTSFVPLNSGASTDGSQQEQPPRSSST